MVELVFHCPVTGTCVHSGIVTDEFSAEMLAAEEISLRCPRCGGHTWEIAQGQLKEGLPAAH